MRQYKIFTTANKLNIIDQKTNIIYSALLTEALVRQLKDGEDGFKIYNVRDWNEDKILTLKEILKEDGSKYTSAKDFIENFNGGGSAPTEDFYEIIAYASQVGNATPSLRVVKNTFGISPVINYVSNGYYNVVLTDKITKDKFIPYSYTCGGNLNNYTVYIDYDYNVDDNSTIFFGMQSGVSAVEISDIIYPPVFNEILIIIKVLK